MRNNIQKRIDEIFNSVEIYPEYSSDIIKIKNVTWNKDVADFIVEYYIDRTKCVFRYNNQMVKELGATNIKDNPLEQLECELKYIKRMRERGIGAKEYYPCTTIES